MGQVIIVSDYAFDNHLKQVSNSYIYFITPG